MNIDDISKGEVIEIDVKCKGKTMHFQSEIAHIINNSILINSIKVENQTIGFSDQCTIDYLYKFDGKLFIWENVNVKLVRYDSEVYHITELLGEGKPHNRRDAYRMYLGEDMFININTAVGPAALPVLVKDISETGVGFITKEEIDVNRTFRLRIKDNKDIITLSGVIVRKETLEHLASNLYGCKFSEKNNMLLKYITKKQGEQLKNKSRTLVSNPTKSYALK